MKKALNARALYESLAKDLYQLPNLDNFMDKIAEEVEKKGSLVFVCRLDICKWTNSATRTDKKKL